MHRTRTPGACYPKTSAKPPTRSQWLTEVGLNPLIQGGGNPTAPIAKAVDEDFPNLITTEHGARDELAAPVHVINRNLVTPGRAGDRVGDVKSIG